MAAQNGHCGAAAGPWHKVRAPMSLPFARLTASLLLAGFLGAAPLPLAAQTKPQIIDLGIERPAALLFIGNSLFYFNNGLHDYVVQLLRAADPGYRIGAVMVTISGSGASWHDVDSYFRPDAIGMYSIGSKNNVVFNNRVKLFDVAIITDCSLCPIHPQLKAASAESFHKHSEAVRRHGAVPVFFMSWGYADKPEMTAELAEAYTRLGNENGALVIPAGLAFANALRQRPRLNLYAGDKRHPSLAGTYLAACTVYASLFKRSPADLSYTAGLDPGTARFLQTVAWDTVQAYYGLARKTAADTRV
jgi:hypothetical protein